MSRRAQPWTLTWADVDPAQWPLSNDDLARLREGLLAVAKLRNEEAFDDVVTGQLGAWSAGWRWSRDEGSIGGGVVSGWCCASHSMKGKDKDIVDRVVAGVADWRAWLTHLGSLFEQLAPRATDRDDVDAVVGRAVTVVLAAVAEATGCGDAWYNHAQQVLGWYLQRWGVDVDVADAAVRRACSGLFSSWSDLSDDERARIGAELGHGCGHHVDVLAPDDVLLRHRALRKSLVPPASASAAAAASSSAAQRDGHALFIDVVDAARSEDPTRAGRMREALRTARSLAASGALVDLELARSLHAIAVPKSGQGFRSGAAYAKDGRERYGFDGDVLAACDRALVEANDSDVGVVFRAGRAYLDLCFFHPFNDGNARAARLVFDLILAREGVVLHDVDALFRHPVAGGELSSAQAFLQLAHTLAEFRT